MEEKKTISRVIPEGELSCIWAEAGLVSYKLCDRNYECDDCPFDQVMRQKSTPVSASAPRGGTRSGKAGGGGKEDTLFELIRNIFAGPFDEKPRADRMYLRNHIWFAGQAGNACRIGVDHYAAALLDGVGGIVFPQTGSSAVRDVPIAWVLCDGETIALHSPVNGRIKNVNPDLMESVSMVRSDPYGAGWLCEIACAGGFTGESIDAAGLESASKKQFSALRQGIIAEFDARPPSLGVTMMDGGMRPRNLKDVLGPAKFVSFLQKLFSGKR